MTACSASSPRCGSFAYTPAVRLRDDTRASYQAGDYDKQGMNVWTGRIQMMRESLTVDVTRDKKRGFVFNDDERRAVMTSETATFFAYDERSNVLVYRDRASIPYTRLQSYVRAALAQPDSPLTKAGISVSLVPREVERTIKEWFDAFTTVQSVTLSYRHSQSPGNRAIDQMLEAFNASHKSETIRAKPGESLSTEALVSERREVGKAIDHLDRNPDNGVAKIRGMVDDDELAIDTRRPVERHRILAGTSKREILLAMGSLVRGFFLAEPSDDD